MTHANCIQELQEDDTLSAYKAFTQAVLLAAATITAAAFVAIWKEPERPTI